MTGAEVIRISFGPEATDSFRSEVVDAIKGAIETISRQHYGEKLSDAEVEICVGKLYEVQWKAGKAGKKP